MSRWKLADVQRVNANLQAAIADPLKRPKYGNSKQRFQGQVFDSKHEFETYRDLKAQELMGAIRAVVRQVSLPLSGSNRRIRIDFMVVENSGKIRWMDAKGYETPAWKSKRDQVRTAYGIKVELV